MRNNIIFEPEDVFFPNTYISDISKMTIYVNNTSKDACHITFHTYKNRSYENSLKEDLDIYDPKNRVLINSSFHFENENFSIDPLDITVWPGTRQQIIVSYHPNIAIKHNEIIYAQINDEEKRIPLKLHGLGLPPVAQLSTPMINIGNVFLDSICEYVIYMTNTGRVPVDFALEKYAPKGFGFEFKPAMGNIQVGTKIPIHIVFTASSVGKFNEDFTFKIKGTTVNHPKLAIVGKVIGPTFILSPRKIDFGGVGFGFLYTKTLTLENTSEIPFDYSFRMSLDSSFEQREIRIEPEEGTIGKFQKEEIKIEFIPMSIQSYNVTLYMDIARFGNSLCVIPIQANSICPTLKLDVQSFDMQNVFIGYKYTKELYLINESPYPAKFEYNQLSSSSDVSIEADKINGIVQPFQKTKVLLFFTGKKVGSIHKSCAFQIFGSNEPPLLINFIANCTGPSIQFSTTSINFGNIPVLKEAKQTIEVKNVSLIDANIRTTLESKTGGFDVSPSSGVIKAGETAQIEVTSYLNDIIPFAATLKIGIDYLNTTIIQIKAQGTGSPITSDIEINTLNFGDILTKQVASKKFTLTNRSYRTVELRWGAGKVKLQKDVPNDFKWEIIPDAAVLSPQNSCEFEMFISCSNPLQFSLNTSCNALIKRSRIDAFQPVLCGTFISPSIIFEPQVLDFTLNCSNEFDDRKDINPPDSILKPIKRQLTIANRTKLPITLDAELPEHFFINIETATIQPDGFNTFTISFDPTFKKEYVTEEFKKFLIFRIANHPNIISIPVNVSIVFPNIKIEPNSSVDFGVLMQNTELTLKKEITNTVDFPVDFKWKLVSNDPRVLKVFDVFPTEMRIEPKQTIETYFSFFAACDPGSKNTNYDAETVCCVNNGPDYIVHLSGCAAPIEFSVAPTDFEFHDICFKDEVKDKITLMNNSQVEFSFEVVLPKTPQFSSIIVNPSSGILPANEEIDIEMSIVPGLPALIKETFYVRISGFDDVRINVTTDTRFAQASINLERSDDDPSLLNLNTLNNRKSKKKAKVDAIKFSEEMLLKEEHNVLVNILKSKNQHLPTSIYVADFGDLIMGEVREIQFDLTNISSFKYSVQVDSNSLKKTGFKVEPVAVHDIGVGNTTTFSISFQTIARKLSVIGPICYSVPLVFSDKHVSMILIHANLQNPVLTLDRNEFNFDQVIIGQTKIMTLQLQNLNTVSCEFIVDKAATGPDVFSIIPGTGILPPSSFMNISIHFKPTKEKTYKHEFPIYVKYSNEKQIVNVTGNGILYKLVFTPNIISMPMTQIFSQGQTATISVSNPTQLPIEFYSLQFDKELTIGKEQEQKKEDPRNDTDMPFVTYTPKAKTPVAASKFSICIIVTGVSKSGKTTVSNYLSNTLNLPIIDLKKLWEDAVDDFITKLYSEICQSKYRSGFIVDGVDILDITGDNETFLQQCTKIKNVQEECQKNPFFYVQHQQPSTIEQALGYLLSSLDHHFVFHIALSISRDTLEQRKAQQIQNETKINEVNEEQERKTLFEMTEDEYNALTPEEQEVVDLKRREYRRKLISQITEIKTNENKPTPKTKGKEKEDQQSKRKSKAQIADPITTEILIYQYTLGSIVAKLQSPSDRYNVLNPSELKKNDDIVKIASQCNTILIDGSLDLDIIKASCSNFIPPINIIKEAAFKRMIPEPIVQDDLDADSHKLSTHIPRHFSIVTEEGTKATDRWYLEPGASIDLGIKYNPVCIGNHSEELLFAIAKSSSQPRVLKVKGSSSYPDFNRDLSSLYKNVRKKLDISSVGFSTDTNTFSFGYRYICKERAAKGAFQYKETFTITNNSLFQVDLSPQILESNNKSFWSFEPQNLQLKSNQTGNISILFHPTQNGIINSKVAFFVKDNPDPFVFNVTSSVCSPIIEINQENINFDKTLPNSSKVIKAELKNSGHVSGFWRLKGSQQLAGMVSFNQQEGLIDPGQKFQLVSTFSSTKALQMKKQIQIEVLDTEKTKVFSTQNLNFTGEVFDVNFDITLPKGMNDCFEFGMLQVGQNKTNQIAIRNKGKYSLNYKFVIDFSAVHFITISSIEGVISPGDKPVNISITFTASKTAKFLHSQVISLTIIDTQTKSETSTVHYSITAEAYFTTYEFDAPRKISFGVVQAGVGSKKEYNIKNTGPFPLTYEFTNINESSNNSKELDSPSKGEKLQPSQSRIEKEGAVSRKQEKGSQSKLDKKKGGDKKKGNEKTLYIGVFQITPCAGTIQPNSSSTISFEMFGTDSKKTSATAVISIPGAKTKEKCSTFKMIGSISIPGIITDLSSVFKGLPILSRVDLQKENITCLLEDEKVLHFKQVIVGQKEVSTMYLTNSSAVEITVDINIKLTTKVPKGQTPFEISSKSIVIAENSTVPVSVTFYSLSNDNYSAQIECTVKGGLDPETNSVRIGLEGSGAIPCITTKTVLERAKNGAFISNVGRLLVGQTKVKTIDLTNENRIPATVIFSIKENTDWKLDNGDKQEITIDPYRSINFSAVFLPLKVRKSSFEVTISVKNNPKSTMTFVFNGEGFSDDILFEGLSDDNELIIKNTVVGRSIKQVFTMHNVIEQDARFVWNGPSELKFSPKVGHIRSGQTKDITVTFFTDKPIKWIGQKGSCEVTKIMIDDKDEDWDDSQKIVSYIPKTEISLETPRKTKHSAVEETPSKGKKRGGRNQHVASIQEEPQPPKDEEQKMVKVMQVRTEPTYRPIAGKGREFPIKIFTVSDVLRCTIDTTEINFAPTMMYQIRYADVTVTNTSQIKMEYEWELENFTSLRTNYALTRQPVFSIEPSTGVIEGEKSTVFRVAFAPMEVDDFSGIAKMKIPYMVECPLPTIKLSAISRRPLCHFNIETSDYLTRRHPDFKTPLPDGVRVIELVAKGRNSGAKASYKVEIINPTSAPYEVKWSIVTDSSNGLFTCDTQKAFVSSGKHYNFNFTYNPKSGKTNESLWKFSIPEHNISVYFLIVGRVSH